MTENPLRPARASTLTRWCTIPAHEEEGGVTPVNHQCDLDMQKVILLPELPLPYDDMPASYTHALKKERMITAGISWSSTLKSWRIQISGK